MKYQIMNYKLMRARKYYDALRSNRPFMKTSLMQKYKIIGNIFRFFKTIKEKPLIVKNKPVTAQIEPTAECNLRCRFCVRYSGEVPIGRMSFEDFKRILKKLDSLYKINISGQGELFIHPEIFDMIRYANKRGILINISSNGTLLNERVIDELCKVEIGEIGISVDSVNKKRYENIRMGADFDKLMKNIKNMTNEFKRRDIKTIVNIAPIIFKENIDELPEFIEMAHRLGVDKVSFQTLQTKENFMESYDDEMREQLVVDGGIELLRKKMKKAKELAEKYGIIIIFDEEESPGCVWPWRGIYITWNGDVTPCCKIVETEKFSMGNILKQNFNEVWNSSGYQRVRKLLRERKSPLMCQGCNRV